MGRLDVKELSYRTFRTHVATRRDEIVPEICTPDTIKNALSAVSDTNIIDFPLTEMLIERSN